MNHRLKQENSDSTAARWSGSILAERVLRGVAIAIVVAGIVDPEFTISRQVRPIVEVLAADTAGNQDVMSAIERHLSSEAIVALGSTPGASARVLVGSSVPDDFVPDTIPTWFVMPSGNAGYHVENVDIPSNALIHTRVPVRIRLARDSMRRASGSSASIALELRENGLLLADTTVSLEPRQRTSVTMAYVPAIGGLHNLELHTAIGEAGQLNMAARTLRFVRPMVVSETAWDVLFLDGRPSWLSTFVRRSLGSDLRFRVSSRVVTSTDISVRTRGAASGVTDLEQSTVLPDVLVVGAPELLSVAEKSALERLVRNRGLQVILLPDNPLSGIRERVFGGGSWRVLAPRSPDAPRVVSWGSASVSDTFRLRSSSVGVPDVLPSEATVVARLNSAGSGGAPPVGSVGSQSGDPVIWIEKAGKGEVLFSTLFDSWRYRDRGSQSGDSDFELAWRELAAMMAQRRHIPVRISEPMPLPWSALSMDRESGSQLPERWIGNTGILAMLDLSGRSAESTDSRAESSASQQLSRRTQEEILPEIEYENWGLNGRGTQPAEKLSVFSTLMPNAFRGVPDDRPAGTSGNFGIVARAIHDGDTTLMPLNGRFGLAEVPFELLEDWTQRAGGGMVTGDAPEMLAAQLNKATRPAVQPYPWYPLRSPWWIVPLTAAMAAEWWLRRRRGLS